MPVVFLSYAREDHFFAELASIKLAELTQGTAKPIELSWDRNQLRAGQDWRRRIEEEIARSVGVVVALSAHSAQSEYVTFEWAYALGKGKNLIPLKLTECVVHPRLEGVHSLDFSIPGALPWHLLVREILDWETPALGDASAPSASTTPGEGAAIEIDPRVRAILAYLNQRGYQVASFDRMRRRVDEHLTDADLNSIVENNPAVFRHATLEGGKPGLAKLVP